MLEIDGQTFQLLNEHRKAVDRVIEIKIGHLKYRALKEGEYKLFEILDNIDTSNIDKTKLALERSGYILELEHPSVEFTSNENIYTATMRVDEVKIKVKKVIFEV